MKKNTEDLNDEEKIEHEKVVKKWEKDHDYCRNYLLNCLSDALYDYYDQTFSSAKEIWKVLEQKYDTEEAGTKKYACSRYFKFQMVENKFVVDQAYDLQMLAHEVRREGINVDEQMEVSAIIDKLPNSWKEFGKILRHKQKELSIETLMARLRVEEGHRNQDNSMDFNGTNSSKVNFISSNGNMPKTLVNNNAMMRPKRNNMKPKSYMNQPKRFPNQNRNQVPPSRQEPNYNQRKLDGCYVCGKPGNIAKMCNFWKSGSDQANMIEERLVAMITEVNVMGATEG